MPGVGDERRAERKDFVPEPPRARVPEAAARRGAAGRCRGRYGGHILKNEVAATAR